MYILAITGALQHFVRKGAACLEFRKLALFALQSRGGTGREVGCGIYVCANRRCAAATEVIGAADLFLRAVLRLAGHGTCARGRAEHGGMADDSGDSGRRSRAHRGGVARSPGDRGSIARKWKRRTFPARGRRIP